MLFGETPGRVLVSCATEKVDEVRTLAEKYGVPATACGTVRAGRLTLRRGGEILVDEDTASLSRIWRESLANLLEGTKADGSGS